MRDFWYSGLNFLSPIHIDKTFEPEISDVIHFYPTTHQLEPLIDFPFGTKPTLTSEAVSIEPLTKTPKFPAHKSLPVLRIAFPSVLCLRTLSKLAVSLLGGRGLYIADGSVNYDHAFFMVLAYLERYAVISVAFIVTASELTTHALQLARQLDEQICTIILEASAAVNLMSQHIQRQAYSRCFTCLDKIPTFPPDLKICPATSQHHVELHFKSYQSPFVFPWFLLSSTALTAADATFLYPEKSYAVTRLFQWSFLAECGLCIRRNWDSVSTVFRSTFFSPYLSHGDSSPQTFPRAARNTDFIYLLSRY